MYVLGIDAGGTKTLAYLAGEDGAVLGEGRGGGANLQAHGELDVEKVLHGVIEAALGDRAIGVDAVCLGMAGVDRAEDTATASCGASGSAAARWSSTTRSSR